MFGYPLHPVGKPHKLRKDQFPALRVPALFLTGTRDSLADLKLLKRALQKYAGDATLDIVQGANHDFQTLAVQRKTPEEVRDNLADRVVQWLASRPEE
jgi:predicted alpha/beta-hydrolase family hydrolase